MKIYFVANARMPTEKAHGIHVAKMCEAFIEGGAQVVLVTPTRDRRASVRDFYHLRVDVPLVRLPTLDLYTLGRVGYRIGSSIFMLTSLLFLCWKKLCGEQFIVYTVDLDNFSSSLLPLVGMPLYSEMHGGKPATRAQKFLFRHARGIIAINAIIVEELKHMFARSRARYLVEPMAVDLAAFTTFDKREAREKLGLPLGANMVLYAGQFFAWKGLEIIPRAAALSTSLRFQMVGGDEMAFKTLVDEDLPPNLFFAGVRPHTEIVLWLAAADALLVLGTKRDMLSYRYTSPMKLFEYMTAGRNIVAAKTPAIEQIVSEEEVFFYTPDDAADLARQVMEAQTVDTKKAAAQATLAEKHTWAARASRILEFIHE